MKTLLKFILPASLVLSLGAGCSKKYLDTNPTTDISKNEMFTNVNGAYTALNGIHAFLISTNNFDEFGNNHANWGLKAVDLRDDMMGNDVVGTGSGYDWFQTGYAYLSTNITSPRNYTQWLFFYRIINNANAIINNIDAAEGPEEQKMDIKGQALAYRAYAYYRLVTYYQHTYLGHENAPGVPIYTTETTPETEGAPRATLSENYQLMVSDLEEAITLLEESSIANNPSHISADAAKGIYARIALTMGNWEKAQELADEVIPAYSLMSPEQYLQGFNSNANPEWIWASNYSAEQYEGNGILCFVSFVDHECPGYASAGATRSITKALYDMIADTDVRKGCWQSGSYIQRKFRSQNPESGFVFDNVYMRVAEMYLISAEASNRLGEDGAAVATLETLIQSRDPNYVAPATSGDALFEEIKLQRRIELWGEGFGYSDIVRYQDPLARPTGSGNHLLSICRVVNIPGGDDQFLYRIPQREVESNPNL